MNLDLNTNIIGITNKKITTLHPKDTIKKAELLFEQIDRRILPVVVNDELRGVLLKRDFKTVKRTHLYLLNQGIGFDYSEMYVEDQMNRDFHTLDIRSTILDALALFKNNRQYFIPIVDKKILVGFVTPFDFINYIFEQKNTL